MAHQNNSLTSPDSNTQPSPEPTDSRENKNLTSHPQKDSKIALLFSIWCAIAILLSAFLVFQIQPVFSKMILPWFGGGPAVWTACLMFFQLTLLAGYAYAFSINRLLPIKGQAIAHLALVFASFLFLPIIPVDSAKPVDGAFPILRILWVLVSTIGLPYFLLSSTAPLFQAWYAAKLPGRIPYRLYALSNVGSLVALLSFPFLIEPMMSSTFQAYAWSAGFITFGVFTGLLTIVIFRTSDDALIPVPELLLSANQDTNASKITLKNWLVWISLAAIGSFTLLSISNHLSQELTVSPLMWVLPLSLYLITFIINFDRPQWYNRRAWAVASLVSIFAFASLKNEQLNDRFDDLFNNLGIELSVGDYEYDVVVQSSFSLASLFFICMIAHGELVRNKPAANRLTSFYMAMATGGALGGMTVAILCPYIFTTFFETPLTLILGLALTLWVIGQTGFHKKLPASTGTRIACVVLGLYLSVLILKCEWSGVNEDTFAKYRNFYGTLRVDIENVGDSELQGYGLYHGNTFHGFQFTDPEMSTQPTTYYAHSSGLGAAFKHLQNNNESLRVGIVGLGTGTTAIYGRENDYFHFYEINPDVISIANKTFSYLESCKGKVETTLADARIAMEREENQKYDLIVLDAFSGDGIPAHLLTTEAFDVYKKHLTPNGIVAVHISNRYLNLFPVVAGTAGHHNLEMVYIEHIPDDNSGMEEASSDWILLTNNQDFIEDEEVQELSQDPRQWYESPIKWTDQYSNLIEVMK
ncbi:fused MFS/spermidine synthase [Mariniblastus sp.]|nr:fused MFS/spermidine synthase [Mariniblastus sp.]MDB4458466.1 fused MFS/spermidine synthase [bacterium]